ncbi:receptor tyrosine-protein kinase erbB-4-like isoform X2 [Convolutriloba macropyga]|uniref:receptor tyrosine-protein kinase erbB-4-like isoform X2 n=1 Tax=Convolutriloba macropyga TaxID=536237 RepID=UPI003F52018A
MQSNRILAEASFCVTISIIFFSFWTTGASDATQKRVECEGTRNELSITGNHEEQYKSIVKRYSKNCTVVLGNLEITFVPEGRTLDFLNTIREVTGYLLIYNNGVDKIKLDNLEIVRGKELYTIGGASYSVAMLQNKKTRLLVLPKLKEVTQGEIRIGYNENLRFQKKVNWADIDSREHPEGQTPVYTDSNSKDDKDSKCHSSCASGYCWGPDASDCQELTKSPCDESCDGGRCFGPGPNQCCNDQCSAGCTGKDADQCNLCKGFVDRDKCVESCPPLERYDPVNNRMEPNPNVRYSLGFECVAKCPHQMLIEGNACVKHCGDKRYNVSGTCEQCPSDFCPKGCSTLKFAHQMRTGEYDYSQLINCTVIEGPLIISDRAKGWNNLNVFLKYFEAIEEITMELQVLDTPLTNLTFLSRLKRIGSRMEDEMANFVVMNNYQLEFLGLKSFEELKHPKAKENPVTLTTNPKLCYVNFEMFRNITVHSEKMTDKVKFMPNLEERTAECKINGKQCDSECITMPANDEPACWGPGPQMCFKCRNFLMDNSTCVNDCDLDRAFVVSDGSRGGGKKCERCHEQCAGPCWGRTAFECEMCKHFESVTGECVAQCSPDEYADPVTNKCKKCSPLCSTDPNLVGCSGPGEFVDDPGRKLTGGCFQCPGVTKFRDGTHRCDVPPGESSCPKDFFYDRISASVRGDIFSGSSICEQCNEECEGCDGRGPGNCIKCKHFEFRDTCVSLCPDHSFHRDESLVCESCDRNCKSFQDGQEICTGTSPFECVECNWKYIMHNATSRECVESCDDAHPFVSEYRECVASCPDLTFPLNTTTSGPVCRRCHSECLFGCKGDLDTDCLAGPPGVKGRRRCVHYELEEGGRCLEECDGDFEVTSQFTCKSIETNFIMVNAHIFFGGPLVALLVLSMVAMCCYCRRKSISERKKQNQYEAELHMRELGDADSEMNSPMSTPDHVQEFPKLKVIKLEELLEFEEIGSGAFGTVTRGVWLPPDDKKRQCPVAVKTLHDSSGLQQQNFIEEAKNMAMMRHRCLVSLVAICMTDKPRLITPLMPHGSLIDYMNQHHHMLATSMLLWCKQIAEGMEYLQSKNVVHRDLAARNVLVETVRQVKISDFGLAKILKNGQATVEGGKFATKWLAIESLTCFEFSHATDVWSLGITVWEILTHGEKPYDDTPTVHMAEFLKNGGRLPQPPGCSLELYVNIMKCWLAEPQVRPSFTELKESFDNMLQDPSAYLSDYYDEAKQISLNSNYISCRPPAALPRCPIPHPDDEYNGPMLVDTNIVYPTNGHANGHDSSSHPVPFVETSVLNSGDFQERTNVHVERYLDEHRRVEEVQSRYDDYSSSRIHHVPGQSVPYENHYPQPTLDVEYGHFEGNGIYDPRLQRTYSQPHPVNHFQFPPTQPIEYSQATTLDHFEAKNRQFFAHPDMINRQNSTSSTNPMIISQPTQTFLPPPVVLRRMHSQPPLPPRLDIRRGSSFSGPMYDNMSSRNRNSGYSSINRNLNSPQKQNFKKDKDKSSKTLSNLYKLISKSGSSSKSSQRGSKSSQKKPRLDDAQHQRARSEPMESLTIVNHQPNFGLNMNNFDINQASSMRNDPSFAVGSKQMLTFRSPGQVRTVASGALNNGNGNSPLSSPSKMSAPKSPPHIMLPNSGDSFEAGGGGVPREYHV